MATIEVQSRILGPHRDDGLDNVFFETASQRLTVRTLILRTVEEQVRDLNARRELTHQDLLRRFARQYQTEDEIRALRVEAGRSAMPSPNSKARVIDVDRSQHQALEAFTAGRFVVFVGDQQMTELDQEIDLGLATKVEFLRVLPLQGGRV